MKPDLQLALWLLRLMAVLVIAAIVWVWRIHKTLNMATPPSASLKTGCLLVPGVLGAVVIVVNAPPLGVLPAAAFAVVGVSHLRRGFAARDRHIAGIVLLCAVVWSVYAAYEFQLNAWMKSV